MAGLVEVPKYSSTPHTIHRIEGSSMLGRRISVRICPSALPTSLRCVSSVHVQTGDLEFYGHKRQNKITLRNLLDTGSGRIPSLLLSI